MIIVINKEAYKHPYDPPFSIIDTISIIGVVIERIVRTKLVIQRSLNIVIVIIILNI